MPSAGADDVQRALARAAKLSERQAMLDSAERAILREQPATALHDLDLLHELLPWRRNSDLKKSCTQQPSVLYIMCT